MARRFRKKAGFGAVVLPGLPGLGNDEIVEGDEYARFCPAILEEVKGEAPKAKPKPAPKPKPKPAPAPEPDPEPDPDPEPEEEPDMTWRKADLVEYARQHGVNPDDMTKREILEALGIEA